jgi:hypothetical protein
MNSAPVSIFPKAEFEGLCQANIRMRDYRRRKGDWLEARFGPEKTPGTPNVALH